MNRIVIIGTLLLLLCPLASAQSMKTYYENGKIQSEMGSDGFKTYYENGQINTETPQINGVPHGASKTYYEDGTLMSESTFENGQPVGSMKMYHPNGELMRELDTKTGHWKQFDENGQLLAEAQA